MVLNGASSLKKRNLQQRRHQRSLPPLHLQGQSLQKARPQQRPQPWKLVALLNRQKKVQQPLAQREVQRHPWAKSLRNCGACSSRSSLP